MDGLFSAISTKLKLTIESISPLVPLNESEDVIERTSLNALEPFSNSPTLFKSDKTEDNSEKDFNELLPIIDNKPLNSLRVFLALERPLIELPIVEK